MFLKYNYLYKKPRRDKREAAVLPVESVVVGVEREVIQVEESVYKRKNVLLT